jgi:Pvc16 N-terminal domain
VSNHLAIATVTAALGQLVFRSASDAVSGTDLRYGRPQPPTASSSARRVHVYLYQVLPHAGLRNADLPTRSGSDGRLVARPQAALELRYLVSFYGDDSELEPDRMLGAVARDLHARPLLTAQQIADAIASMGTPLQDSDLADSIERVKFTPVGLSLDELSKLWSVLVQTPHALSLVCHASVVLIDALERAAPVLPVLRRGEQDRGVDTRLGTLPQLGDAWVGWPDSAARQPRPPSLRAPQLGARLIVQTSPLAADSVVLRLTHPQRPLIEWTVPWPVTDPQARPNELALDLPDDAAAQTDWAAGLYSVVLAATRDGRTSESPVWPLLLAPRIMAITPNPVARVADVATLGVTCRPQVQPLQAVSLRIGELEVPAEPRVAATDTLSFVIDPAPALTAQLVWLRVDGALSQPVALDPVSGQFVFDDAQRVTIT